MTHQNTERWFVIVNPVSGGGKGLVDFPKISHLLRENGILVEYEVCVPRIRNREGTGFCPMESAVLSESDPHSALEKIIKTRDALLGK